MSTTLKYVESYQLTEKKRVIVDKALLSICKKRGKIDMDILLEEVKNPKNVLHPFFEWNDEIAGEKWRRAQAYTMIYHSQVVARFVENGNSPKTVVDVGKVRRLVSAYRGDGFMLRDEALGDADKRGVIIKAKKGALRSWCKGVVDIEELNNLRELILKHLD